MDKQHLDNLRHSCAHLLAAAVMNLWPHAKRTIGPSIENGFYFDFDFGDTKISDADLPKIEKEMSKVLQGWKSFERHELSADEAKKEYPGNEFKHELIEEFSEKGETLTFYKSGEYWDLCRGGHCENPSKELRFFKLLSVAGAYWRGSEKNKMLTRIYGTCFPTKSELQEYLTRIEEAKKRDHRKIAAEMDLFTISHEVGQGLTLWLANGAIIRKQIEDYMVQEQIKLGFKHVYSPHIGLKSLWEKSGHWDLYREKMYSPMDVDGQEYLVKPMTCPMHIQSFTHKPLSYRNLPFRIAEIASVYRYEQSGELNGLLRVRAFTQDDAHIFCTPEQAVDEFLSVFTFIQKLYAVFGFNEYRVRLGIRSNKEKYLGDDSLWEKAQEKAIEALKKVGADYFISEGDAAFYGPKADFLVKDALGREWQCGTVQIDFMLPERFNLKYIDHEGKEQTPVMIHRAPLGSLERFFAILIEQYAGKFPVWLAPQQVAILPISDKHLDYAKSVQNELVKNGIRAETNSDPERIGKKIRIATLQKVPYMIIIGDKEVEEKTISIRTRDGKDLGSSQLQTFINTLKTTIENHS
jgi:threonyl-tRNA synthetase